MQQFLSFLVSLVLAVVVFVSLRYALTAWLGLDQDIARWVSLALGVVILMVGRRALTQWAIDRRDSSRR